MSFQGKAFWMAKDGSCLNNGEMSYDGSSRFVYDNNPPRIEPKRGQPWFLDASESELFPNKKQAVETSNRGAAPQWENGSSFQTVSNNQFTDRLFGSEPARNLSFSNNTRSIPESGLNLGRPIEEQFESDASIDLTMSQTMEDPGSCLSYGGIRKVKINQVKESSDAIYFNQVRDSENSMSMSMGNTHTNTISFCQGKDPISMGHAFNKGDSNTISFSGFQDESSDTNPSGSLISNYDLLASQSPSESPKQKELAESNAKVSKGSSQMSKNKAEMKVGKKIAPNNFPSNVRSLLSTGILDDVPVKYISWSREELRGVIKGSGYLCGCETCSYKKILNAYEFERHAGCKTKHPNNHIYFDNGKTIYAVVQELRSTPQNMLFEAIQTVTGSPINDKSFRTWKESFQAATRELERIYGKEEIQQL